MLANLPTVSDANVLVGFEGSDDGAVYRLSDDLAVVQSLDVLTPVVDDPYDFGRIAAANSVSDLYAMGATPKFALSFVGFPRNQLPLEVLHQILKGGTEKAEEAGMPIIGGHTIDDVEPKYGLAVTGTVHPDQVVTNSAGNPGDVLVLTKPLGSGVVTTANKRGKVTSHELAEAVEMMATLNASAATAMKQVGAKCATDVTGFGLLGHLRELALGSGTAARIDFAQVPVLESALRLSSENTFPGGSRRNLEHLKDSLSLHSSVSETEALLLADAQTSGGLLIAVRADNLEKLLDALTIHGVTTRAVIGELVAGVSGTINVEKNGSRLT